MPEEQLNSLETSKPYGSFTPSLIQRWLIFLTRHTVLGRGKAKGKIWPLIDKPNIDCYDLPVRNYQMRLYPKDNTVERKLMVRPDRYCPDEINFFTRVFGPDSSTLPRSYIDIGANIGALTLPVASMGEIKVIAIEPEPTAFKRLEFNVNANNFKHVALENVALSDSEGVVDFISHTDDLKLSGINGRWSKGEKIEVKSQTLVGLLNKYELSTITVLKIDVEGHEDRILLPFFSVEPKSRWPRYIIVEAIEREGLPDCIDVMYQLGYKKEFQNRANLCLRLDNA